MDRKLVVKRLLYSLFILFAACEKYIQVPIPYNDTSFYQDVQSSTLADRNTADSVVLITTANARGTGFFVSSDGVMMTNDHVLGSTNCFREGCFISLLRNYQKGATSESVVVFAKPLHVDKTSDASIFQIYETKKNRDTGILERTEQKFINTQHLKITETLPQTFLNQEIFTIGHPLGSLKKVTSLKILDKVGDNFRVAGALISGQSGSPVVNQEQEVIGIVKTSTMSFTDISPHGMNTTGEAIVIRKTSKNSLLSSSNWYSLNSKLGNIQELHSLNDNHILQDWPQYMPLFLSAKKLPAQLVDRSPEDLADELHRRCQNFTLNLHKGFLSATEREKESVEDCLNIQAFTHCPKTLDVLSGVNDSENWVTEAPQWEHTFCPSLEKQKSYAQTMISLFDFGYQVDKTFSSMILIQASMLDPEISYEELFSYKLNELQPTLNFDIATEILGNELNKGVRWPNYQGQDLVQLFLTYKEHPHYKFFVRNIITGLMLIHNHQTTSIDFRQILNSLLTDPEISLADKFWLEDLAYANNYL